MFIINMRKIKTLVFYLLLIILAFSSALVLLNGVNQNYNVVFISVDSLRPDHLGTYGYDKGNSPNIDSLASSSRVFSNFYSIYPSSVGSYYSLFTGNNYIVGNELPVLKLIKDFDAKKNNEYTNLTTSLKKSGYNTFAFVSNPKLQRGIFKTGFDEFVYEKNDSLDVDKAIEKIKSVVKNKFFVWVDFNLGQKEGDEAVFEEKLLNCPNDYWTEADTEEKIKEYDQNIGKIDSKIGKLVKYIKEAGLEKNTLVVIYSDKGENFDPRYFGLSKTLYNSDTKSVLIVKDPKKQEKETVTDLVDNSMVFNLVQSLTGKVQPQEFVEDKSVFARLSYGKNLKLAVTNKKYKYIYNLVTDSCLPEKDASEFYDLIADPGEKDNLIDDPSKQEIIKGLKDELTKASRVSLIKLDEKVDILERLKSLGY